MAEFTRIGYGQVEPNQLSGIKTGQIFASLPLDTEVSVLQNGEFMYYDYASGKVSATDSTGTEPYTVWVIVEGGANTDIADVIYQYVDPRLRSEDDE